jgi:hypothetical protein
LLALGYRCEPKPITRNRKLKDNQQPNDPGEEHGDSDSKWGKFLPLPIFITEPAIGVSLGGSLIYFHREKRDDGLRVTTGREISNSSRRSIITRINSAFICINA